MAGGVGGGSVAPGKTTASPPLVEPSLPPLLFFLSGLAVGALHSLPGDPSHLCDYILLTQIGLAPSMHNRVIAGSGGGIFDTFI